ncbi:PAS domain S-box protein (macronuclear) [Tetrahymena thermophila SB210]|uniref:PAS domain S-box protein n=1 Tax=Tetrahymena thermophila (strain SB210) TaxID=312017 RepID=Q23VG0_TETTS|nr:PAS domain S-box protein [Tetrahymena thermophila SB210]EAS00476.2 PAS domain S-box protein [Tetrahymena thermophila SB210]|eukprot:XP_001020721.2 PAS domain S-box protein [Tetrahymena thermophila SB210]
MIKLEQALILFWMQLIATYNYFFQENTIVVFFWIVGIVFLTLLNIYYEPITNEICAANSFNYKYAEEVLQYLRVLCFAVIKYDQYSLKVDGFLNRHRNDCNETHCPSRSNSLRISKLNQMLIKQTSNEDLILNLDFSLEITNEESSKRFIKILNNAIQNLLNFWQELLEPSPQAENLIKTIQIFSSQVETIQTQFEQMIQKRSINLSAINYFQTFTLQILEDEQQFTALQGKTHVKNTEFDTKEKQDKEYQLNEKDMYTKGSIVISSQEENFSNIIEVNSEMLKIIGYKKSEILSKNVSMLIPNIWQHHHDQFIDQFLATGQKNFIGKEKNLFIKCRQNYSLPITLNITTITSLTKGLMFQAFVIAQNLLYDYPVYIITLPDGQIDTISPSAVPMFNIQIKKIQRGMYVEKIIPQFWEYILEFQQKQGKELFIKTYQQEMMKETKVKINVEQIRFMKLKNQGYIIKISLLKSEQKSSLTSLFNKNIRQNINKQQNASISNLKDKTFQIQQENSRNISNEDFTESSTSSRTIKIKKNKNELKHLNNQSKSCQMEIFYDMRTNNFLGTMVEVPNKNYFEDIQSSMQQKTSQQQIFNLLNSPKQNNQILSKISSNDQSQIQQKLYPFIFTSERSQKERIQDILDSNDISKQKDDAVGKQVRQILENLIRMQHITRKKKADHTFELEKKSIQVGTSEIKLIPQVYLKPHEIFGVQEDFQNRMQYLLFNSSQISSKVQKMKQSGTFKMYLSCSRDIKTLRLQNNKLIDPNLANESEENCSENSFQNIDSVEKNQQNEAFDTEGEQKKEIDQIVNSKKNIKSFMRDENFNNNNNLFVFKNVFSLMYLIFEIVYMSLSLFFYQEQISNTITRFQMFNVTHLYFANTQHIIEGIFNMFAIDKGSYYNYDILDYQTAEFFFQQYLESETIYQFALDQILTKIYLNNVGVTQQMQDLFINNRNIKLLIHFNHIQTTVYPNNLYQASQQVLAKVYHFKRVPLGQFDHHNNDIFINLENFSNQLLNQIIEYRDYQREEISNYLNYVQNYQQQVLFAGLMFIIAYLILAFFLYLKTLFYYQEISSVLTTIPFSQVRNQVKKYEKILNNNIEEHQENEVLNEEEQDDEKESQDQNNNLGNLDDNQQNIQSQNCYTQESKSPKSDYYNQDGIRNSKQKENNKNNSSQNTVFHLRNITSQNGKYNYHSNNP